MSISDKFSIIENHLAFETKHLLGSKIENYFENFINSDMKIFLPDFIKAVVERQSTQAKTIELKGLFSSS